MVVSKNTIIGIEMVLKGHLSPEQTAALIKDLHKVPGNQSWRDTIDALRRDLDPDYGKLPDPDYSRNHL